MKPKLRDVRKSDLQGGSEVVVGHQGKNRRYPDAFIEHPRQYLENKSRPFCIAGKQEGTKSDGKEKTVFKLYRIRAVGAFPEIYVPVIVELFEYGIKRIPV
jgi:hypothetical protein